MKSIKLTLYRLTRNVLLSILICILGSFFIGSLVVSKEISLIKNDIYKSFDTIASIQGESFYSTHKSTSTYYDSYNEYKRIINELADYNVEFMSVNYMLEYCRIQDIYGRSEQANDAFYYNYDLNYYPFDDGINYYGVSLIGTNTSELIDELTNHVVLTDGRHFTKQEIENENVVIIPNNLVNENGNRISVGDHITVQAKLSGPDSLKETLYNDGFVEPFIQLKVIGMYEVVDVVHDVPPYMYSTRIYTTNKVVEEYSNLMIKNIEQFINVDDLMKVESEYYFPYFLPNTVLPPYYKLKNYEDASKFKEKAEILLSNSTYIKDYYNVVTTNETVDRLIEPISSIDKLTSFILNSSFIALGLLVFSVIVLFVKKRTYEIAIHRALGMKKSKVILKYCVEILIAVIIGCVGIKLFAPQVSSWVSNKIVNTVKIEENNQDTNNYLDYFTSGQYLLDPQQIENKNMLECINVNVTHKEYLICCGYISIVSFLGCVYIIVKIFKTNVKDILM